MSDPSALPSRAHRTWRRAAFTTFACACLLSITCRAQSAQRQFSELEHLPFDRNDTAAIAAGDLDGDGDQDLVIGNTGHFEGQKNRLYLNDGSGHFLDATAGRLPVASDNTSAVLLVDIDRDGDLDLLLGNINVNGAQNQLFLNDGTAKFTDVTATHLPAHPLDVTTSLALADVDGDGDLDLAVGNKSIFYVSSRQNRLYRNDGLGKFTDVTSTQLPIDDDLTTSLVFVDVDRDGDQDLVTGNTGVSFEGAQNRLYLNDGRGTFTDATQRLPAKQDATWSLAAADLDGDGAPEIIVGNFVGQTDHVLRNDGKGGFSESPLPTNTGQTYQILVTDVNRDLRPDLILAIQTDSQTRPLPAKNRIFVNQGQCVFADETAQRLDANPDMSYCVTLADVNVDGDLDLIVGNRGQNKLHLNDGRGRFADATAPELPEQGLSTLAVASGDVDGDGSPDLVLGHSNLTARLYLNDKRGAFRDVTATHMPAVTSRITSALALGDIDGDGDLDLLIGNDIDPDQLFVNDGTGHFKDETKARLPGSATSSQSVAFGDIDGDGDLDILLGVNRSQQRLYVNDGTGHFTDESVTRLPASGRSTSEAIFADVDGDGDLDIVRVQGESSIDFVRLHENDGHGFFTDVTAKKMPNLQLWLRTVAAGDVDGDGDLDLVLGGWSHDKDHYNRLFLNDGKGHFTDAMTGRLPFDHEETNRVVLGDIDEDGDLDLVCANALRWDSQLQDYVGGRNELYLNDGKGHFTDATASRMPVNAEDTRDLLLVDVDADGDLDLIAGNIGQSRVHVNRHRQSESGWNFSMISTDVELSFGFSVEPGYSSGQSFVVPCLALGTSPLAMPPFGEWWLEFGSLVIGDPVAIPSQKGELVLGFTVKDGAWLLDRAVYAQGLVISGPVSTWRLTNVSQARAR